MKGFLKNIAVLFCALMATVAFFVSIPLTIFRFAWAMAIYWEREINNFMEGMKKK